MEACYTQKMIGITAKAAEKIKALLAEKCLEDSALRVGVKGGGCSGLMYHMDFDKELKPGDKVFEAEGVRVVVDPKSYIYLKGTTLDYSEELMGAGFRFNNPNVKRACGCGESFTV